MARRLIEAGLDVRVWNRSADRADAFRDSPARVADSPQNAVDGADVILTMLFDESAVRDVIGRAVPGASRGAVWMQSSTVGVAGATRLSEWAQENGLRYVDAPMLGTKDPAEKGALTALLAGDADAVSVIGPVLEAVSSRAVHAGDAAPAASALKLAANAWIATITAGIGQSLTIAAHLGIPASLVLEALHGTGPDSAYVQLKGRDVLSGEFDPQFAVAGLLKDIRLAQAETPSMNDALLEALEGLYARAVDLGAGHEDIAAVWKAFQE